MLNKTLKDLIPLIKKPQVFATSVCVCFGKRGIILWYHGKHHMSEFNPLCSCI